VGGGRLQSAHGLQHHGEVDRQSDSFPQGDTGARIGADPAVMSALVLTPLGEGGGGDWRAGRGD
jgi:hypothetical protein